MLFTTRMPYTRVAATTLRVVTGVLVLSSNCVFAGVAGDTAIAQRLPACTVFAETDITGRAVAICAVIVSLLSLVVSILSHSVQFRLLQPKVTLTLDQVDMDMNVQTETVWIHLDIHYAAAKWWSWLLWPRPATNCRVMLQRIDDPAASSDTDWSQCPSPPLQFRWPLDEPKSRPRTLSIAPNETIRVDFGALEKTTNAFVPFLYQCGEKYGEQNPRWGFVEPNRTVKYHIYFVCDQLTTRPQVFAVHWDGAFPVKRNEVWSHLTIETTS